MKTAFNVLFIAFLAIGTLVFSAIMPNSDITPEYVKPLGNIEYNRLFNEFNLNARIIQKSNDKIHNNIEKIKKYQTKINQNDQSRN